MVLLVYREGRKMVNKLLIQNLLNTAKTHFNLTAQHFDTQADLNSFVDKVIDYHYVEIEYNEYCDLRDHCEERAILKRFLTLRLNR